MSWVRREDLDRVDKEFGLVINQAWEGEESGVIKYEKSERTERNRKIIDEKKGRKILSYFDDFPIYYKVNEKEQVEKIVRQFYDCLNRLGMLLKILQRNNKKCGYEEEEERTIVINIEGKTNIEKGIIRNRK